MLTMVPVGVGGNSDTVRVRSLTSFDGCEVVRAADDIRLMKRCFERCISPPERMI